jgi:hypothetical protein
MRQTMPENAADTPALSRSRDARLLEDIGGELVGRDQGSPVFAQLSAARR